MFHNVPSTYVPDDFVIEIIRNLLIGSVHGIASCRIGIGLRADPPDSVENRRMIMNER
jgi:hypothetical protein